MTTKEDTIRKAWELKLANYRKIIIGQEERIKQMEKEIVEDLNRLRNLIEPTLASISNEMFDPIIKKWEALQE